MLCVNIVMHSSIARYWLGVYDCGIGVQAGSIRYRLLYDHTLMNRYIQGVTMAICGYSSHGYDDSLSSRNIERSEQALC
jgi:hypothetical protein